MKIVSYPIESSSNSCLLKISVRTSPQAQKRVVYSKQKKNKQHSSMVDNIGNGTGGEASSLVIGRDWHSGVVETMKTTDEVTMTQRTTMEAIPAKMDESGSSKSRKMRSDQDSLIVTFRFL
mmetsp:Transcript_12881/g.26948  ORF Transcript_12881/g.26948 Transcript_12881/m.26948 type:complete len:121 (+) Transcript_12881:1514-1876(+)